MELSQYETFSYPNELAGFDFKATWKVPKDEAREGVTIQTLFLSHDPVQLLTGTIDCAVVIGTDGLTLHFGATSAEDITQVKNKMRNILKYYVCHPTSDKSRFYTHIQYIYIYIYILLSTESLHY